ncbi:MAG: hypothetical protein IPO08_00400 [Xanthomonadales bacterium]|nr:hypothetical protein [Xanthomonadales bacterium]
MKARNVLLLVAIGLPALAMADYQAAPWPAGNPPDGWRPEPYKAGSWFSMERNGAGWAIERLPPLAGETRPLYAGTLYTYGSGGLPYWLLMAGTLEYVGWQEYFRTGATAKFSGVLNDGINGACPTCAYHPPTVGPSPYGTGEIRFLAAAEADVYVNGTQRVERIKTSEHLLLRPVASLLEGEWKRFEYLNNGTVTEYTDTYVFTRITTPAWAGNITAAANVQHKPRATNTVWYSHTLPGWNMVYDMDSATIRAYNMPEGTTVCGEELTEVSNLGIRQRIGYIMTAECLIFDMVLIDDNTIVETAFYNNKDRVQNLPVSPGAGNDGFTTFRYERVRPQEQQ